MDEEIFSQQIQVERKQFIFSLRANARGRFLRITEDVGGRRDTIIVPSTGLERVREVVDEALHAERNARAQEDTADS